jgi:hypothetical protein
LNQQIDPHPNPLPEGEGIATSTPKSYALSSWEKVGVRAFIKLLSTQLFV